VAPDRMVRVVHFRDEIRERELVLVRLELGPRAWAPRARPSSALRY
jgi:hypothetical protein